MPELTRDCEAILESRHMDVIELDGATQRKIEDARDIVAQVQYAPVSLRYKVYIIDEVHMLTKEAFNALLKTLEEPPPHVKFIFATTEVRKVPITILSRCQRFDLKRLDAGTLTAHLGKIAALEQVNAEPEALAMIARAAEGSVRDGLSLLDQAISYAEGNIRAADVAAMLGLIDRSRVIDLFDAVMAGDTARALTTLESQYRSGGEPLAILSDLADFVHWTTRIKVVKEAALADPARTEAEKIRGADYAQKLAMAHLTRAWSMLLKGIKEVEQHADPLMAAEMVLIRLAHAADMPSNDELVRIAAKAQGNGSDRMLAKQQAAQGLRHGEQPLPPAQSAANLAIKPVSSPPSAPPDTIAFSSFNDIVALAADKRDIKLKSDLERLVRPIRVSTGQIELALEPGASPGLPGELARKLEAWTGMRWMVLVAKDGGERPLALQNKETRDSLFRAAREHPDVQAILKRFPDAEIVDVRAPETPSTPLASEADEESR
jgi:DNA polymerase-3 subunit gamma/tau